ncbi:MAG: FG-GAP repeat protein [Planctomycetes bacterium]|nr:FG-GAP repeat protein [Planctomycetota bacterium]
MPVRSPQRALLRGREAMGPSKSLDLVRSALAVGLLGTALVAWPTPAAATAAAQEVEWQRFGRRVELEFGRCMVWFPDLDGDRIDDLAVSLPGLGVVEIVSSASFKTLRRIEGERDERFGDALAVAGDLDGDGGVDLWIGSPRFDGGRGRVAAYSPATAARLREVRGHVAWSGIGQAIAVLSDLDGDGCGEIVLPSQSAPGWIEQWAEGAVTIHASRDGAVLARRSTSELEAFGRNVAAIDDRDGDGCIDFVTAGDAGAAEFPGYRSRPALLVQSGRDAKPLSLSPLERADTRFAEFECKQVRDVDGDGKRELLVSGTYDSVESRAWLVSGAHLDVRFTWHPDRAHFGAGLADAGDVDCDGFADVVAGVVDRESVAASWGRILSGRDGSDIGEVRVPIDYENSGGRLAFTDGDARDLDSDARADVVVSYPPGDGWLGAWSPASQSIIRERNGPHRSGVPIAASAIGDVDGDGVDDAVVIEEEAVKHGDYGVQAVTVCSGRDGTLLGRGWLDWWQYFLDGSVGASPDFDGDGSADFWVAQPGAVRLFSGRDVTLVREFTGAESTGFGRTVAAAHDATRGATVLAVGSPTAKGATGFNGAVELFEAQTGALLWRVDASAAHQRLGRSIAPLGDVDGDGHIDFAVGAFDSVVMKSRPWIVDVLSGADGALLHTLRDVAAGGSEFGASVAPIGDLDSDGRDDLLIGAPSGGADRFGEVHLVLVGSFTTALVIPAGGRAFRFGRSVAASPDVNGDGRDDVMVRGERAGLVLFHSGSDGSLLVELEEENAPVDWSEYVSVLPRFASAAGSSTRPALLVHDHRYNRALSGSGCVQLISLDDLFFTVAPRVAVAGTSVEGWLRGGVPGAACGIYLVELDGVPFEQFLDFGVLDASGHFFTTDVVPPGLAGTVYRVRGYSVGFDGSVTDSRDLEIAFE